MFSYGLKFRIKKAGNLSRTKTSLRKNLLRKHQKKRPKVTLKLKVGKLQQLEEEMVVVTSAPSKLVTWVPRLKPRPIWAGAEAWG